MTIDGPGELPNGHPSSPPPEVKAAVDAVARARTAEVLLVVIVCVGAIGLVATTAWNTYRLRALTQQNVKAQDFGLKAIDCILDNFAEHRWSNQAFHDRLGEFLHAPTTPRVPLPNLPTDADFAADCGPFNRGKVVAPPTVTPEIPSTTATTTGGADVSSTSTTGR